MSESKAERLAAAKSERARAHTVIVKAQAMRDASSELMESAICAWEAAEDRVRAIEAEP